MGDGISHDIGRDTYRSRGAAQDRSSRLCDIRNILGLPSSRCTRMGDVGSKDQSGQHKCLALLTELLQNIVQEAAHPLSTRLIDEFGSLAAVLAADDYALRRVAAAFPEAVTFLCWVREAMLHSLAFALDQAPVIATGHALRDYLFARLAHALTEEFRVLFLNAQNRLIRDELMGIGTIDQTSAYPREIIKRALELGALGVILVHNHPSGDSTPSSADIALTRAVANACDHLDLRLIDHVIIARTSWSSMRACGLL
jgi:DNA repair protein RadC